MSYPIPTASIEADTDTTLASIQAMRQQEESAYHVSDYFSDLPKNPLHEAPVDDTCRRMMAKWCSDIADFCKYRRETVFIAMNCLDRFMATEDGRRILLDRHQYQLAAMTSLYTSVKIHEHEAMDPPLVSNLSRGVHSPKDVETMELRLLTAVGWRVNPPTAFSYVRKMLALVPDNHFQGQERETILDIANFQIDLATSESFLGQQPASKLGFASLLNAVENVATDSIFTRQFENTMSAAVGIELIDIRDIRIRLYECISGSEPMDVDVSPTPSKGNNAQSHSGAGDYSVSPRTVNE